VRGPAPLGHIVAAADAALAQAREAAAGIALLRMAPPAVPGTKAPADMLTLARDAIATQQVELVGQGAYRLSDHRILHTEVMARLRDPAGREVTAAEFLPALNAQGLAEQLDRIVIERVLAAARGRDDAISVNLSIRSLERPQFVQWLLPLLRREPRLAARLVFELAENAAMENAAAAADFAHALAGSGAGLALDNFGIRRDSLALAQRIKPAYLKLAGAHIGAMVASSGARFYAESLISAARQLDIPVIAQSVQDEAVFQAIAGLGFAGYQGNLDGWPSPWPRKV